MKTLTSAIVQAKNALDSPTAWIHLFDITLPDATVLHLAPNPTTVNFDGVAYSPFPCTIDTVKSDSRAGLDAVQVSVANVDRLIGGYVEQQDLRGAAVRLRIVNSANLGDPAAVAADETYEITEIIVTEAAVAFRLGHSRILQQRFPNGRYLRDNCRWLYKSAECGFVDGFAGPGTVSSSGTWITGTNTDFLTRFQSGDTITAAGQSRVVATVTTNVDMTVTVAPSPVWSTASYTIDKPTCDKILEGDNGCRAHSNQQRFGAFPAMPAVGGR